MWLFNQASAAARAALIYITAGALIDIWAGVWGVYLYNNPPDTTIVYYWGGGFFLTGLVLMVIGFGLGRIGRAARYADTPAALVPTADVAPVQNVATRPVVAPAPPLVAETEPDGPVLVPERPESGPLVTNRNLP